MYWGMCLLSIDKRAEKRDENISSNLESDANILSIMTAKEIIQALGGPTRVGHRLGIRSQAVSLWGKTDRIPAERVPELELLARELGSPVRAEQMRPDVDWWVLRGGA